jgi:hypothetical protein
MFKRSKKLLTIVVLAGISISCGSKESGGEAATTSAPPAPLSPGISQNLAKDSAKPAYNFDYLGTISYPAEKKSNQLSSAVDNIVAGWALGASQKGLAGGVDVVIDQVPYNAHYGVPRTDVADHFKCPDCTNSGFQLTLAHGQLSKGPHTVSIRVINSDKKTYGEGAPVQFTVN